VDIITDLIEQALLVLVVPYENSQKFWLHEGTEDFHSVSWRDLLENRRREFESHVQKPRFGVRFELLVNIIAEEVA